MLSFFGICKKSAHKLKKWLVTELPKYYDKSAIINGDGFVYVRGSKVMLTAHMDTVHERPVKNITVEKHEKMTIISSPQGIGGDDRCGIFMILEILRTTEMRPTILFCEDEEIGGIGSNKFCHTPYLKELSEIKFIIELDRANASDLVYYNCGNADFMKFCENTTGYKTAYGTFSDICHLSPALDVASVNISCGYYKQHTLKEYVIYEEMENSIEKVKALLAKENEVERFDYQEDKYISDYYDFCDYKEVKIVYIEDGVVKNEEQYGISYIEAIGNFLLDHMELSASSITEMYDLYNNKQIM